MITLNLLAACDSIIKSGSTGDRRVVMMSQLGAVDISAVRSPFVRMPVTQFLT